MNEAEDFKKGKEFSLKMQEMFENVRIARVMSEIVMHPSSIFLKMLPPVVETSSNKNLQSFLIRCLIHS